MLSFVLSSAVDEKLPRIPSLHAGVTVDPRLLSAYQVDPLPFHLQFYLLSIAFRRKPPHILGSRYQFKTIVGRFQFILFFLLLYTSCRTRRVSLPVFSSCPARRFSHPKLFPPVVAVQMCSNFGDTRMRINPRVRWQ